MLKHYEQGKDIESKLAGIIRAAMFLDKENKYMIENMARLIMNEFILIERTNSVNC